MTIVKAGYGKPAPVHFSGRNWTNLLIADHDARRRRRKPEAAELRRFFRFFLIAENSNEFFRVVRHRNIKPQGYINQRKENASPKNHLPAMRRRQGYVESLNLVGDMQQLALADGGAAVGTELQYPGCALTRSLLS